jgi:hypothetical protein
MSRAEILIILWIHEGKGCTVLNDPYWFAVHSHVKELLRFRECRHDMFLPVDKFIPDAMRPARLTSLHRWAVATIGLPPDSSCHRFLKISTNSSSSIACSRVYVEITSALSNRLIILTFLSLRSLVVSCGESESLLAFAYWNVSKNRKVNAERRNTASSVRRRKSL